MGIASISRKLIMFWVSLANSQMLQEVAPVESVAFPQGTSAVDFPPPRFGVLLPVGVCE